MGGNVQRFVTTAKISHLFKSCKSGLPWSTGLESDLKTFSYITAALTFSRSCLLELYVRIQNAILDTCCMSERITSDNSEQ